MKNLHYLLLKEIYDNYGRTGTSLNSFIRKYKPKTQTLYEFTVDIKSLIDEFHENNIVTWGAEPMELRGHGFQESGKYQALLGTRTDPKYQTFEDIYVEVQLTFNKGLEYAGNIIDREVTRKSITNTNCWMIILTIILALSATIDAALQINSNNRSWNKADNQSLQEKKLLHQLQDSIMVSTFYNHHTEQNKDSTKNLGISKTPQ